MQIHLELPTSLQATIAAPQEVDSRCETVGAVLKALGQKFPELQTYLFSEAENLRSFVNIYVNERNIRMLSGLDAPIADGDTLRIVTAMAGG